MAFTSQLEQGDWYIMAVWLCVVVALSLYGIGIAVLKLRALFPKPPAHRRARAARAQAHTHRARPGTAAATQPPAGTPEPAANRQWSGLIAIVEAGLSRAEVAVSWHSAAHDHIDAADYALNRLIAECAKVMRLPTAEPAPEQDKGPRKDASRPDTHDQPEPLAA
jgi:hypothetical protein